MEIKDIDTMGNKMTHISHALLILCRHVAIDREEPGQTLP